MYIHVNDEKPKIVDVDLKEVEDIDDLRKYAEKHLQKSDPLKLVLVEKEIKPIEFFKVWNGRDRISDVIEATKIYNAVTYYVYALRVCIVFSIDFFSTPKVDSLFLCRKLQLRKEEQENH